MRGRNIDIPRHKHKHRATIAGMSPRAAFILGSLAIAGTVAFLTRKKQEPFTQHTATYQPYVTILPIAGGNSRETVAGRASLDDFLKSEENAKKIANERPNPNYIKAPTILSFDGRNDVIPLQAAINAGSQPSSNGLFTFNKTMEAFLNHFNPLNPYHAKLVEDAMVGFDVKSYDEKIAVFVKAYVGVTTPALVF